VPARSAARRSGHAGAGVGGDAVAMAQAALAFLATRQHGVSANRGAGPECLRGLERAESLATAARAGVLAAFHGERRLRGRRPGLSPGVAAVAEPASLMARRRCGGVGAAAGRAPRRRRRARRRGHLGVGGGAGESAPGPASSLRTGRQTRTRSCWPPRRRRRPGGPRRAGRGNAAPLRRPDPDDDGGFADRWLRLDLTLHRAGRVEGDLTPAVRRRAAGRLEGIGQESRPGGHAHKGQATMTRWRRPAAGWRAPGACRIAPVSPTQIQLAYELDQLPGLDGAARRKPRGMPAAPPPPPAATVRLDRPGGFRPRGPRRAGPARGGAARGTRLGQPPWAAAVRGRCPGCRRSAGSPMGARSAADPAPRRGPAVRPRRAGWRSWRNGCSPCPAGTPSLPLDVGRRPSRSRALRAR